MKKKYISPRAEVYDIDLTCMICTSPTSSIGGPSSPGSLPGNYEGVGGGSGKGGGWSDYEGTDPD